jgi:hypothetical protein
LKRLYTLLVVASLLLLTPALAGAQSRTRRSPTPQRRGSAPARASSDAVVLGRLKVAEKIKLISEFLYVYGGVANQVETSEAQARESGAGAEYATVADRSRASLRKSLLAVRDGLDQLEIEFRTSPDLQRYYNRLAGVAAGAADAEELAASNQLKPAGRATRRCAGGDELKSG